MKKATLLAAVLLSTWATLITAADLSWDLEVTDTDKYKNLIGGLRNELKDSTTCFGIPMMGALPKSPKTPDFVMFKLILSTTDIILVALQKDNAYVWGYSDTFAGKSRAFVLKDAPESIYTKAFPEPSKAHLTSKLLYGGRYAELEDNAGIARNKLTLTRETLLSTANGIFGGDSTTASFKKSQAKFFLLVAQMISESIRFKYFETQVAAQLSEAFYTDDQKLYTIVNKWGTISTAVGAANAKGVFKNSITLTDPAGMEYKVNNVDGVKQDIAILVHISNKCAKTFSLLSFETGWASILYAGLNG